jgi:hypothetical protein
MKNTIKTLIFAVGLTIVSFPGGANAAITFTETSDFSGNLGSPFIIPDPLGLGANTITGSLPIDFVGMEDADVFHANNPNGFTVSSITVDILNFVGTTTNPGDGGGALRLEDPGFDQKYVLGSGQFSLVPSPSNASVFEFRFFGPSDFFNSEAGSMDYLVTLNAVPEPSSVLLLVLGALGLVTARLKRNS